MIYLAMSCYQARPQIEALNKLMQFEPDGIQLTPGNIPSKEFKEKLKDINVRFHHGFCWNRYKQDVYDKCYKPLYHIKYDWSIHPPANVDINYSYWLDLMDKYTIETMYPSNVYYMMHSGNEIIEAINKHIALAVDISHLKIMYQQGFICNEQLDRLLNYDNIKEIHISDNDSKNDRHWLINKSTFLLDWAKERNNIPRIYESYLHKATDYEIQKQLDLLR